MGVVVFKLVSGVEDNFGVVLSTLTPNKDQRIRLVPVDDI